MGRHQPAHPTPRKRESMTNKLSERLRVVAEYRAGTDLTARLAHVEEVVSTQRLSLLEAAAEIERLTAKVAELEAKSLD